MPLNYCFLSMKFNFFMRYSTCWGLRISSGGKNLSSSSLSSKSLKLEIKSDMKGGFTWKRVEWDRPTLCLDDGQFFYYSDGCNEF